MKTYFTLDEFLNFKPKKPCFAVFGYPLKHTLSPMLHTFLFKKQRINATYIAVEIPLERFNEAVEHAKKVLKGFNVTLPFKSDIIPLLDDIDATAKRMESVNTVIVQNGKLKGFNTDIFGISKSFELDNIDIKGKNVALLGCGGVSRTFAHFVLSNGGNLTVYARDNSKLQDFKSLISGHYPNCKIVTVVGFDLLCDTDIVINGTSVGMHPNIDDSPIKSLPSSVSYVFDCIYTPYVTKLLQIASNNNIKFRNGIAMLALQGIKAEQIWLDINITDTICRRGILRLIGVFTAKKLQKNISLIGFMASGKTTVGKILAESLGFKFIDADVLLEKLEGSTISEIFQTHGELYFRDKESQVIASFKNSKFTVISTGGGAPMRNENAKNLKQCSKVVYLEPPIDFILNNINRRNNKQKRPVVSSSSSDDIIALFTKRQPIYQSVADITIKETDLFTLVELILLSL